MISIIVNNYGRSYLLPLLIQAYNRFKFEDDEVEMVIVDDNSPEPFEEYLNLAMKMDPFFDVRAFQTNDVNREWVNPGITINIAVKQSRGDIIILNHSDVLPLNPHTLKEVWKYHGEHDWTHLSARYFDCNHINLGKVGPIGDDLSLQGSSMPRKLYDKIGGFDERFKVYGHEDTDFLWRLFYGGEDIGIKHHQHEDIVYLHITPSHALDRTFCPPDNEKYIHERPIKTCANKGREWGVWDALEVVR